VAYVNLLRSNDSLPGISRNSGPGVWGMMKVPPLRYLSCAAWLLVRAGFAG
jgi:hypothetical protein